MNRTAAIKFTNNGRRAHRLEGLRWFPMKMADAQSLLLAGKAVDWTGREDEI